MHVFLFLLLFFSLAKFYGSGPGMCLSQRLVSLRPWCAQGQNVAINTTGSQQANPDTFCCPTCKIPWQKCTTGISPLTTPTCKILSGETPISTYNSTTFCPGCIMQCGIVDTTACANLYAGQNFPTCPRGYNPQRGTNPLILVVLIVYHRILP